MDEKIEVPQRSDGSLDMIAFLDDLRVKAREGDDIDKEFLSIMKDRSLYYAVNSLNDAKMAVGLNVTNDSAKQAIFILIDDAIAKVNAVIDNRDKRFNIND